MLLLPAHEHCGSAVRADESLHAFATPHKGNVPVHTAVQSYQAPFLPRSQATLAAANVAAVLSGYPVWNRADILPFVDKPMAAVPRAAPSIVNAKELGLKLASD